jgi:hypothetical protein
MPQQVRQLFFLAFFAIAPSFMAGCSYHFQETHNPLVDLGIRRIYVKGFGNRTFRPGIEQYFTTAIVREIGRSKSFELVNSPEGADAVLSGIVTGADSTLSASKQFTEVARQPSIATEYAATVSCDVVLTDRRGRQIFAQSVSGNKVHPGAAATGDAGATAPLINDSEQRLAVQFLASQMMASVYQRMVDTF